MKYFEQLSGFLETPKTLFPAVCVVCRRTCNSHYNLCEDCETDLPWIADSCERCAMPLPIFSKQENGVRRCGKCIGKQFDVDACCALFCYTNPINSLIAQFKFGERLDIGRCFGYLLGRALKSSAVNKSHYVLIPVPMHFRRFLQRGFNQSWELARYASKVSGIEAERKLVHKTHYTAAQSQLDSKAERRSNVVNSFSVTGRDDLKDVSRVTIIDDVVTTMSTVSALAKSLKNEGIQWVEVYCIARAGT